MKPAWTILFDDLTETELVQAAQITHMKYRQHHPNPTEQLPDGAVFEIYNSGNRNIEQLARVYKTTTGQIQRAAKLHCNAFDQYTDSVLEKRVKLLLPLSIEDIAERLNVPMSRIKHLVPEPLKISYGLEVNKLLEKGLDQNEVATLLKIAPSTVSYHNKSKKQKPRKPKCDKWDEIIARARAGESVSALAREYNVARTTIIARLNKESE